MFLLFAVSHPTYPSWSPVVSPKTLVKRLPFIPWALLTPVVHWFLQQMCLRLDSCDMMRCFDHASCSNQFVLKLLGMEPREERDQLIPIIWDL